MKAGNTKGRAATSIAEQGQRHLAGAAIPCQGLNVRGSRGGERQEKGEEAGDKSR